VKISTLQIFKGNLAIYEGLSQIAAVPSLHLWQAEETQILLEFSRIGSLPLYIVQLWLCLHSHQLAWFLIYLNGLLLLLVSRLLLVA